MVKSRSRVKVIRKGHQIFASARWQTLLSMHKKFDSDIIVSSWDMVRQRITIWQNNKREALRECRPPWPRQIITLILPTVKMLSLGYERLPTPLKKKKKKKKGSGSLRAPRSGYATTITVFFCSFTHLTILRSPAKFNQFFLVLLRTRP